MENRNVGAEDIRHRVRAMYKTSRTARAFFDSAAQRKNDVAETKLERIAQMADTDYQHARELARQLEESGCGTLIVGRKGYETRFRWAVSLPSLGRVAAGTEASLSEIDPEVKEAAGVHGAAIRSLNVAQAKRLLAESLGIGEDKIEIIIRA